MVVLWFSQDATGIAEYLNKVDQHTANQKHFGLPERRIAKIFVFRQLAELKLREFGGHPDRTIPSQGKVND